MRSWPEMQRGTKPASDDRCRVPLLWRRCVCIVSYRSLPLIGQACRSLLVTCVKSSPRDSYFASCPFAPAHGGAMKRCLWGKRRCWCAMLQSRGTECLRIWRLHGPAPGWASTTPATHSPAEFLGSYVRIATYRPAGASALHAMPTRCQPILRCPRVASPSCRSQDVPPLPGAQSRMLRCWARSRCHTRNASIPSYDRRSAPRSLCLTSGWS